MDRTAVKLRNSLGDTLINERHSVFCFVLFSVSFQNSVMYLLSKQHILWEYYSNEAYEVFSPLPMIVCNREEGC